MIRPQAATLAGMQSTIPGTRLMTAAMNDCSAAMIDYMPAMIEILFATVEEEKGTEGIMITPVLALTCAVTPS